MRAIQKNMRKGILTLCLVIIGLLLQAKEAHAYRVGNGLHVILEEDNYLLVCKKEGNSIYDQYGVFDVNRGRWMFYLRQDAYDLALQVMSLKDALEDVDYTEVICPGDSYVVLKKDNLGFDQNELTYGIYDTEQGAWVMECTTIPGGDGEKVVSLKRGHTGSWVLGGSGGSSDNPIVDNINGVMISSEIYEDDRSIRYPQMIYNGSGVFSYRTDAMIYWYNIFLSADAGDLFSIGPEPKVSNSKVRFVDGTAITPIHEKSEEGYVDGHSKPATKLCILDSDGFYDWFDLEQYPQDGSPEHFVYWGTEPIFTSQPDQYIAYRFSTIDKTKYLMIYQYQTMSCIIFGEQEYMSRIWDTDLEIEVTENGFIFRNLHGDDGRLYSCKVDQYGDLVEEARLQN